MNRMGARRANASRTGGLSKGMSWAVHASYVSGPAEASSSCSTQSVPGQPLAPDDFHPMHQGVRPSFINGSLSAMSSSHVRGIR